MTYEVNEPILNNPFDEPSRYWYIREDYEPELREGRRPPIVYPPREGKAEWDVGQVLKRSRRQILNRFAADAVSTTH